MIEADLLGVGVWGSPFSNWADFSTGIRTGQWQEDSELKPALLPPNVARRAPRSVKMAVEVMQQACLMASVSPQDLAVTFSSMMGDSHITDQMCRTLASEPRLLSPTQFHNSVHNAPVGYWSIATGAHAPVNAMAAFEHSAPVALLEAAIQVVEENTMVLLVTQEVEMPKALGSVCASRSPFSSALVLARPGAHAAPLATLKLVVGRGATPWPPLPEGLRARLSGNPGAALVPVLAALATQLEPSGAETDSERPGSEVNFLFPLSEHRHLSLTVIPSTAGSPEPKALNRTS
jgi:hypothetical protein